MNKRPRGTGSLYRQPGSQNWWCQYSMNGRPQRESTGTSKKREAESFLRKRLAEVSGGNFLGPQVERITVGELACDYFDSLRVNEAKDFYHAELRWKTHLEPVFANCRAGQVNTTLLNRYVRDRQENSAANGTINRELAALQRMYTLAAESDPRKVGHVPHFPRLPERNVRKGFLEQAQYSMLAEKCAAAGLWLRAMFEVAHTFAWRTEEIATLEVSQVDLSNRLIRLWRGETKNDDGRVVHMTSVVYEFLCKCVDGKKSEDYVFTKNGKRIGNFRKTWWRVCVQSGLGQMACRICDLPVVGNKCGCGSKNLKYVGLLFHDLRRTGVRNMVRSGIPERVAMSISGHKTRAVFDRYNIVSESDLAEAARKMELQT